MWGSWPDPTPWNHDAVQLLKLFVAPELHASDLQQLTLHEEGVFTLGCYQVQLKGNSWVLSKMSEILSFAE